MANPAHHYRQPPLSQATQSSSSPALRIALLGSHEIFRAEQALRLSQGKPLALLAYLALHSTPVRRDHLALMLWPELSEGDGRNNLRGTLHGLRNILGSDTLVSDRETIWLSPLARQGLDIERFNAAFEQQRTRQQPEEDGLKAKQLSEAARLYRGELISDLKIEQCSDFEDWLHLQRLTMHRRMISLLETLTALYQRMGDTSNALSHAESLTALDPSNEHAHRQLIRLLAASGQTNSALRQYELMTHILEQELGVEPDEASHTLFQQLKQQQPPARSETPEADENSASQRQAPPSTAAVTIAYLRPRQAQTPAASEPHLRQPIRQRLERHCAHVVYSHCGGVLAYFGYPVPLENTPQRSAKAIRELLQDPALTKFQLGVGLHTGQMETYFDDQHPDLSGRLTATAIELGKQAEPGSIRISQSLAQSLGPGYQLTPLIARRDSDTIGYLLNPNQEPMPEPNKAKKLFGRQQQQQQLQALWQQTSHGNFSATLLKAPAGLGKSRLGAWCTEYARHQGGQVHTIYCHPQHQESFLHPVADMLRQSGQHLSNNLGGFSVEQLNTLLDEAQCPRPQRLATTQLAQALGLENPTATDPKLLADYRQDSLQLLCELIAAWAKQRPLLLLVEDVHWADHSTLEWLEQLQQRGPKRVMMLFTARPQLQSERLNALPQLPLPALDVDQAHDLLRQHGASFEPSQLQRVVAIAEGVPLFLEQLGSALQEGSLHHDEHLPRSLQEVLGARLIQLGPAHRLIQIAATLGNTFDLRLLRAVAEIEHDTLFRSSLEQLRQLRLIDLQNSRQGQFLHNLIREAAYESQSRAQARQTHANIAKLWPVLDATIKQQYPEWLAEHHNAAGELERALEYWHAAARQAADAAAHVDAAAHCHSALASLDRLPPSSTLDSTQLELTFALGCNLLACQGYGSAEARDAFKRALQIAPQLRDDEDLFRPLFGLWLGGSSHGDYDTSYRAALKLERLAERSSDPTHRLQAAYALGNIYCWRADLPQSRQQLEKALALYHELQPNNLIADYGEDSGVASQAFLSWVYWFVDEDERAHAAAEQSIALAKQLEHPFSQAFAHTFVARFHQLQGDTEGTNEHASQLLALAKRYDFPLWQAAGELLQGWAIGVEGDDRGIGIAEQGLNLVREAMPSVEVTFLAVLTDLHFRRGYDPMAQAYAQQALDKGGPLYDHYMQAELTRLRALLHHRNGEPGAEQLLRQAQHIAESQGAKRIARAARDDLLTIGARV